MKKLIVLFLIFLFIFSSFSFAANSSKGCLLGSTVGFGVSILVLTSSSGTSATAGLLNVLLWTAVGGLVGWYLLPDDTNSFAYD